MAPFKSKSKKQPADSKSNSKSPIHPLIVYFKLNGFKLDGAAETLTRKKAFLRRTGKFFSRLILLAPIGFTLYSMNLCQDWRYKSGVGCGVPVFYLNAVDVAVSVVCYLNLVFCHEAVSKFASQKVDEAYALFDGDHYDLASLTAGKKLLRTCAHLSGIFSILLGILATVSASNMDLLKLALKIGMAKSIVDVVLAILKFLSLMPIRIFTCLFCSLYLAFCLLLLQHTKRMSSLLVLKKPQQEEMGREAAPLPNLSDVEKYYKLSLSLVDLINSGFSHALPFIYLAYMVSCMLWIQLFVEMPSSLLLMNSVEFLLHLLQLLCLTLLPVIVNDKLRTTLADLDLLSSDSTSVVGAFRGAYIATSSYDNAGPSETVQCMGLRLSGNPFRLLAGGQVIGTWTLAQGILCLAVLEFAVKSFDDILTAISDIKVK